DAKSQEFNINSLVHTDFKNEMEAILRQSVVEDELEEALKILSFNHIIDELSKSELYRCSFNVCINGKRLRKQWQVCYLDNTKQTLLLSRSDISETYQKEQQQLENLKEALIMAQQASVAKSDFLSRMSHEIRTPMNAIIGMSTLAAQCIQDPLQVADCISKVGISARFLLSLINDILDMSRIESGKVIVKKEKIPFEHFIYCINTICHEQASQKGVDYDAIILSFTEDYYIGDSMKLQQVLINIIGNAIKFTPAGGKVQFMVNQEKIQNGRAYLKFTVNDTGIGIKEEFMSKLFQPFEQEDSGITAMYGGTGLGLAICSNLLKLMGGKISVNSLEGIGTEFTVELSLELCDENPKKVKEKSQIQFDKMSALIVDDEILICESTRKILTDMGIKADLAESGEKAIEIVRSKWKIGKYYNIIFIDWKMPHMDGIETTRAI
ncbi:MAG: ATP-binding protein, partial [Oscillospiraceae bacterium]